MLIADHLSLRYPGAPRPAVDDVSFWVEPGEIVALLGLNGAGKSSTIAMLTGLLPAATGTITIAGNRLDASAADDANRATRARIGYVPDRPYVYGHMTAREFCRFHAALYGVSRTTADTRAEPLFTRFGLAGREDDLLEHYSHGMRQKVILIASLLHEPAVLILDEPIVGLDPESARTMLSLLREFADRGASVVFSTHLLSIAADIADRILVVHDGRLVADGALQELRGAAGIVGDSERDLEAVFFALLSRTSTSGEGRAA